MRKQPPLREDILGEAHCDAEGFLHGWCWNSASPTTRMAVELLVEGAVIRKLVASRFREDLRERGIGDGYHAFSTVLPAEACRSHGGVHAAVRAADTGKIIWQVNAFSVHGDAAIKAGLQETSGALGNLADTLERLEYESRTETVALCLKELATHLRKQVAAPAELRSATD